MRGVKKANLPTKICRHCGRDFAWRKKWARDWDHVQYCSDACRKGRPVPVPLPVQNAKSILPKPKGVGSSY